MLSSTDVAVFKSDGRKGELTVTAQRGGDVIVSLAHSAEFFHKRRADVYEGVGWPTVEFCALGAGAGRSRYTLQGLSHVFGNLVNPEGELALAKSYVPAPQRVTRPSDMSVFGRLSLRQSLRGYFVTLRGDSDGAGRHHTFGFHFGATNPTLRAGLSILHRAMALDNKLPSVG